MLSIPFMFFQKNYQIVQCSNIHLIIFVLNTMSTSHIHTFEQRNRTTSNASIRKRLLRSSSQARKQFAKNSTTQSFRSAIKPKFQRLLQQDKIEVIMNADSHSRANLFYTTHVCDMEKQLNTAKKALNIMVMKTKLKQHNMTKLKNQLTKLQREIDILKSDSQTNKNKLTFIQQKFGRKKGSLQDKAWEQKCYKHIKSRLQKDEQNLKQWQQSIDKQITTNRDQIAYIQQHILQVNEENSKLHNNLSRAKQISKEQIRQKNQFINLLNEDFGQKDMLNNIKQQNITRQNQIQQLLPSIIQKEERQKYLQILFTHKLVHQIIKTKSINIMQKNREIQNAYLYIKSNTNIIDISKILFRMETQDQQYQNLLLKVQQSEKQLEDIQNNIILAGERQCKILSMDDNKKDGRKKINYHGVYRDQHERLMRERQKFTDKKFHDEILKKKIMAWVNEYSMMFEINQKVTNEEDFFIQLRMLRDCIEKKISNKDN